MYILGSIYISSWIVTRFQLSGWAVLPEDETTAGSNHVGSHSSISRSFSLCSWCPSPVRVLASCVDFSTCPRDPLCWKPRRRGQGVFPHYRFRLFLEGFSVIKTTWVPFRRWISQRKVGLIASGRKSGLVVPHRPTHAAKLQSGPDVRLSKPGNSQISLRLWLKIGTQRPQCLH
jgi:hypothetical protein